MKQKITILLTLLSFVFIANSFAMKMKKKETSQFKNLQVLPNDIDMESLKGIMKSFNTALGVKCDHCHAASAINPEELDFASDAKFQKEIARGMMKMTKEINENYFAKHPHDGMVNQIECMTCHNGKAEAHHIQKPVAP